MRFSAFTSASHRAKHGERGQTMALVALSMFTLIAMAALAIDLTTLYQARGEMQRAADAAALAGAKAFVDSTVTNNTADGNRRALANTLVAAYIDPILTQNAVGGVKPTLVSSAADYTTHPGNPQITVTLQRTNIPTFFARIFGRRLATVRATAIAEAYNSSLPAGGSGGMPPVAPSCVKPWLIPNVDPGAPTAGTPFIDETTGSLRRPGTYPNGAVGEKITLQNGCFLGVCGIAFTPTGMLKSGALAYFPAQLASAANGLCPSCVGASDYEQSSACCDTANSSQYKCGTSGPGLLIDTAAGLISNTVTSVECVIGATGTGPNNGQDEIGLGTGAQAPANSFGNFLASNGRDPIEIRAGSSSFRSGQLTNTSQSIVTVPIFATSGLAGVLSTLTLHVEGYMQVFVEETNSPTTSGEIDAYVLNISGCGPNVNTALPAVSGGGTSPVPVRLIHN